jgi:hypothetical protein
MCVKECMNSQITECFYSRMSTGLNKLKNEKTNVRVTVQKHEKTYV